MKMNLRLLFFTAIFAVVLGCASSVMAQRVGGYKKIAKTDAGAVAAADFAISAEATKTNGEIELVSINTAESQVVAGTNFRLCMSVKVGTQEQTVIAVVYRNLKAEFSLTSWVKGECSDGE